MSGYSTTANTDNSKTDLCNLADISASATELKLLEGCVQYSTITTCSVAGACTKCANGYYLSGISCVVCPASN